MVIFPFFFFFLSSFVLRESASRGEAERITVLAVSAESDVGLELTKLRS